MLLLVCPANTGIALAVRNPWARGFSLMELIISLAIISILITSVTPFVSDIITKNSSIGQINQLNTVVQMARYRAISQQSTATLCPTHDFSTCTTTWDLPKMIFIDGNGNGIRDQAEQIVAGLGHTSADFTLTSAGNSISFYGNGSTATPSTLLLCHSSNKAQFAKAVTISLQGRVTVSGDADNDGVDENNAGEPLQCNDA